MVRQKKSATNKHAFTVGPIRFVYNKFNFFGRTVASSRQKGVDDE